MKEQFDRYFELLPVLVIALFVLWGEQRQARMMFPTFDRTQLEWSRYQVEAPKIIFR
ncbi:hypothetical protein [Bryobacter aggregatus]|uniref:hypothetical protein n=1 Tax=Bryobacter aggregatus TaxID=360054 RepID=UPI0012BA9862|nr:hypothetical protein [Bryobacter aggregatus]